MWNNKVVPLFNSMRGQESTTDQLEGIIAKYEGFFAGKFYSMAKNFEVNGRIKLDSIEKIMRFLVIMTCKLMTWIFCVRCFVNIMWPSTYIRDITCNGYELLGSSSLVNLGLAFGNMAQTTVASCNQYFI